MTHLRPSLKRINYQENSKIFGHFQFHIRTELFLNLSKTIKFSFTILVTTDSTGKEAWATEKKQIAALPSITRNDNQKSLD